MRPVSCASIQALAALAGAGLLLAACGGAASAPPAASDRQPPAGTTAAGTAPAGRQAILDTARKEGRLVLVWGEGAVGGSQGARRLAEGLNKHYGLNIDVQFTPGPAMPDMGIKILQEFQTNKPASADIFIGSEAHFPPLMAAHALETVDWASWSENVNNPKLLGVPDGEAVEIASRTPGITYHTSKLAADAVPKSMEELLQPRYKGHMASTVYAAMFDRLASPEMWGEQRTIDYVTKLSAQISGLIRCGESDRISSGEFELLALDCGADDALRASAKGAPLAQVVPSDAPSLVYWYMGVPRNAAHPNAAKLFIDYLMGRDGQDIMYQTSFDDHYLVPGSHTAGPIQKLQAAGVKFQEVDINFVQRNDEKHISQVRQQLQNILAKK